MSHLLYRLKERGSTPARSTKLSPRHQVRTGSGGSTSFPKGKHYALFVYLFVHLFVYIFFIYLSMYLHARAG
jgi:hypothetical protein